MPAGNRHGVPASDGCAAVSRSHRRRHAAWSLAPRVNGRWRQLQPPFCPCRIRVDFRDGAIDQDVFEIRRVSQGMEKPLPHARMRPTPETRMDRSPFAKHLRQIAPAGRIAGHPQDRVNKQTVVDPAPPRRADTARQVTFNTPPLFVRQCASAQGSNPPRALNQNSIPMGIPECRQTLKHHCETTSLF